MVKVSRYVIGLLVGLSVILSLTMLSDSNADAARQYNVNIETSEYLGDFPEARENLYNQTEDMKNKLGQGTGVEADIFDKIGAIMSAGLSALNFVWQTVTLPITVVSVFVTKIIMVNYEWFRLIQALIIFMLVFVLIAIKVKSDKV